MAKVQNKVKKFKIEYLFIIILTILALFIFFSSSNSNSLFNLSSNYQSKQSSELENKITETLSKIQGVGKVSVLINSDEDKKPCGVVVVCEGANDLSVKLVITEVLTTVLDVSSENIRILKMK